MTRVNFGGVVEEIVTRMEYPIEKAQQTLQDETVAILGYGVQGPAQALNLRENGVSVVVGQRKDSPTWEKALADGWIPGTSLFPIDEAAARGTIVHYLVSDAAQKALWPTVRSNLQPGNALSFSHGFAVFFKEQTGVEPPNDVDVILIAPKGSGANVRTNFLDGSGINSSYAVGQDATGRAVERTLALGIAIGSGYLFPTTFRNEVVSDLTGERGVLMGALAGVMEAQYAVLRTNGHSPSEAFNETVEELTQSLIRLVGQYGMDGMFARTSTTAQRGALDWKGRFQAAVTPVFADLYRSVVSGEETRNVLQANASPSYRGQLEEELRTMRESEFWAAGAAVRQLRPEQLEPGVDA